MDIRKTRLRVLELMTYNSYRFSSTLIKNSTAQFFKNVQTVAVAYSETLIYILVHSHQNKDRPVSLFLNF